MVRRFRDIRELVDEVVEELLCSAGLEHLHWTGIEDDPLENGYVGRFQWIITKPNFQYQEQPVALRTSEMRQAIREGVLREFIYEKVESALMEVEERLNDPSLEEIQWEIENDH